MFMSALDTYNNLETTRERISIWRSSFLRCELILRKTQKTLRTKTSKHQKGTAFTPWKSRYKAKETKIMKNKVLYLQQ